MKRNCCSGPDPSCELRTLGVRNSATTGAASATATATTAQPHFDKNLLAKEIKAARENMAGATESATESATRTPKNRPQSCALNENDSSSVVIGPWQPATPDQVTEIRHKDGCRHWLGGACDCEPKIDLRRVQPPRKPGRGEAVGSPARGAGAP